MFKDCDTLTNIEELKNLETKNVYNFEYMFSGCSSLSDIKSLSNWDVSNSKSFQNMFSYCTKLTNVYPLEKIIVKILKPCFLNALLLIKYLLKIGI